MTKKTWLAFTLAGLLAAPAVEAQAPADSSLVGNTAPGVQETLAAQADVSVENVQAPAATPAPAAAEGFVAKREEVAENAKAAPEPRVVYNPKNRRDPTLSPDDFLLLQYREQQRLAAL